MSIEELEEARATSPSSSYSFNSPSTSPTLNTNSNWDQTTNGHSREHSDLTRANLATLNCQQGTDAENVAISNTETGEWNTVSRGRTNRKRSNSTQSFVCVVAWLVKPEDDDVRGNALMEHIQQIRRKYDNAHSRWEPHVTLIPPFLVPFGVAEEGSQEEIGEKNADDAIRQITDPFKTLAILSKRIEAVCASYSSQLIHFGELSKFSLRRYDTYHLRPNQEDALGTLELVNLQNALANVLPEAHEFSRGSISNIKRRQSQQQKPLPPPQQQSLSTSDPIPSSLNGGGAKSMITDNAFKPHLTLGQAPGPIKADEINVLVEPLLLNSSQSVNRIAGQYTGPLIVKMDKIQLFIKPINRSGPYDIFQEFNLR
ncbi:uncharacterized protein FA14DRAFT_172106 [Meira miltonrushii]|uniref:LigT-like protein n=1 Tax=Meira miltonrushii TaxID=1280837 RepID=A0A316VDA2_9BASI|nr:uncharacterized protein FA14DRAFT_172106 [Meira miltonrushii]PWN35470.1 hypothetical protein FA14DRAFT_172106 [Meira miltonrushii]